MAEHEIHAGWWLDHRFDFVPCHGVTFEPIGKGARHEPPDEASRARIDRSASQAGSVPFDDGIVDPDDPLRRPVDHFPVKQVREDQKLAASPLEQRLIDRLDRDDERSARP
ncbi:hypothetical protein ACM61V_02420 [Sphingomonas sp. TX0543]|uniref:hypothetical protein n=1 Tax=unclassified Sphingomonas TaxID=196159 RepID=UPI0014857C19|nr:hypothetical protein [Sphingomonas sp. 3P27F8]